MALPSPIEWVILGVAVVILILLVAVVIIGIQAQSQFTAVKRELDGATATLKRVQVILDVIEFILKIRPGVTREQLLQTLDSVSAQQR